MTSRRRVKISQIGFKQMGVELLLQLGHNLLANLVHHYAMHVIGHATDQKDPERRPGDWQHQRAITLLEDVIHHRLNQFGHCPGGGGGQRHEHQGDGQLPAVRVEVINHQTFDQPAGPGVVAGLRAAIGARQDGGQGLRFMLSLCEDKAFP
ncbi:hypothetical protein WCLP8_2430004 [uncultured Gammaproteobacteria bacterium]